MNHLTEEQFEDLLQGRPVDSPHLRECAECKARLAEKKAMAERLRSAFSSVSPAAGLADRISADLGRPVPANGADQTGSHARILHLCKQVWPKIAAAAAILIVLVPLGIYFVAPPTATAAQEELVGIHHQNMSPDREFYSHDDPEQLAQYFKEELGFTPALPCTGHGLAIRGCCVAHFRGKIAGSYVVNTPKGIITVIVVKDSPESMGMARYGRSVGDGKTYWQGSFAMCRMVTVRLGNYSYCAVAEVSHEYLQDLLRRLLI